MDGLLLPLALLILGVPLAGLFLGVASVRRLRELEARILALAFTAAQLRELARRGFAPVTAPEPGPQAPTPVSEPRPVSPSPEPATPSVFAQPPRPAAPAPPTPITPGRIDAGNGEDFGWRRLEGARDRGARQPGRLPHAGAAVDQSRCGGRALHVPRGARRRHGGLRVLEALAGVARAELYVHAAALSRVVPALVRRLAAAAGHRAHRRRRVLSAVFAGH